MTRQFTRRAFVETALATPLALAAACTATEPEVIVSSRLRLDARKPSRGTSPGTEVLGSDLQRAYLRVPPTYNGTAMPLIIALHGASGRGDTFAATFGSRTDALGAIVLAPNSTGRSWDIRDEAFATDVPFINGVLDQAFDRCNIDARHIAILGFSDGASYAISLGLGNADQLSGVVAFSPGFYTVDEARGVTDFFVSHGTSDNVLPIDLTSRKIVPELRARGHIVTYQEFDGSHAVTTDIADQAMSWLHGRYTAD